MWSIGLLAVDGQILRSSVDVSEQAQRRRELRLAPINRTTYLVTWNLTHIANAAIRGKIEEACRDAGLRAPTICTPEELMEA